METDALTAALAADLSTETEDAPVADKPVTQESKTPNVPVDSEAEDKLEAEPEGEAEESEEAEAEDDGYITLPITDKDGNPVRATAEEIQEWRENGKRLSDYTRQVQEAVAKQKAADTERETLAQERQANAQKQIAQLQQLQQAIEIAIAPELQNINWDALAQQDVQTYIRLKQRADNVQAIKALAAQKQQMLEQAAAAEQTASLEKRKAEAIERLPREIPNWSDQYYMTLCDYAVTELGYDREAVLAEVDYRAFKTLHRLYQLERMQKVKPQVQQTLKQLPKVVKPGSNGGQASAESKRVSDARKNLKQSGSPKDLTELFRSGVI